MRRAHRPRIAIPARLADSTSATRHEAIVTARRLAELIWDAGGEPLTFLPVRPHVGEIDWADRLAGIDGVLMPGGADIDPAHYGESRQSDHLYGIDPLQDETDFALVRHALATGMTLLTICRGTQVANVALGGSLTQHMSAPHINHRSNITFVEVDRRLGIKQDSLSLSCFHHQAINRLAEGITPLAFAQEGHVEALRYQSNGWAYGLQWHPEDNYKEVRGQLEIARAFIEAAKN
jgi:putative glutamine amidotransferase